ncbi:MAG: DUF4115 domain-containing protein [Nitrospirales bacterium]|nr:DUF4115 domain-containing protein [Nitrospirales bacterium]
MGSVLKERREELGQKIEDIARETRISVSCLRAIEEENYPAIPIEVYGKGYIREYARHLGVPEANALAPYEKYIQERKKTAIKEQPVAASAGRTAPSYSAFFGKLSRRVAQKDLKKALWAIPFIAAGVALYSSMPHEKDRGAIPVIALPAQETVAVKPVETRGFTSAGPSEANAMATKRHLLEITATDKVWVKIISDNAETKEALLNPGDKQSFQADSSFHIVIGNAGGVTMSYDGKDLGPLGDKGEVLKMALPEQNDPPLTAAAEKQ